MLVNVKLNVSGYKMNIFQAFRPHWPSQFLMAQLKQSWQCWHSCICVFIWHSYDFPEKIVLFCCSSECKSCGGFFEAFSMSMLFVSCKAACEILFKLA